MKYLKKRIRPDYKIVLTAIGLSLFGLIMIASASVVVAYEKFGGSNEYYFVWHQGIAFLFGLILMGLFAGFDYRNYKKISVPLLIVTIILLVAVFLPGIGSSAKGAHRWLNLGVSIQPSEIAKITFIVYLCAWLDSRADHIGKIEKSLIPFALLL